MTNTIETTLASIGALKSKVMTFPTSLYDARLRLEDLKKRLRDLEAECKDAEIEELLLASQVRGGDGKPLHSNETTRKAAAAKALSESPTHGARLKACEDARTEVANAALTVQKIEDEWRSWRTAVDLTLSEVQLLVAGR